MATDQPRVAILYRGDPANPGTLDDHRLAPVARALASAGLAPVAAVFAEEVVRALRVQLLAVDMVLVWVNPVADGRDRRVLDALLRDVAAQGVAVSAHPDTIERMGTKEVLYRTRAMAWGSDVHHHRNVAQLRANARAALARREVRVIKRLRGNGGEGVWKVEPDDFETGGNADPIVRVLHARRGATTERLALDTFIRRIEPWFDEGGAIDQPWQARLGDGMVRCYGVGDRVAGFGEQRVNALLPATGDGEPPQPGPRLYYPPSRADLQELRTRLEEAWVPELCATLGIDAAALPVIWDADFFHGEPRADGSESWVLGEINVSSVFPFPDEALEPLAREVRARLARRGA